jgi:2-polyprenyl-6-hydroxyphenyl methylase/3-demethylubiquinone-9 3-methyltransferase
MKDNLELEAEAFDHQIIERVRNGHVPDLRFCTPCDYFYNNSWRRPEFVALDMGEQFARIQSSLTQHFGSRPLRVLEVGCGPGFISLEIARAGHSVIGIDLSPECIRVANDFASKDPLINERGSLEYVTGDFFTDKHLPATSFDAVVFVGALHHFKEQEMVMQRVHDLLVPGGLAIAHEPTRDRVSMSNATLFHLLTRLLAVGGGFYEKFELPKSSETLQKEVNGVLNKMRYESESGEKLQSVNDNDAGHPEMTNALRARFQEIEYDEVSGFYHEVIGGLRFSESLNAEVAKYIREIDRLMCSSGVVSSTEFYFVGKK